MKGLILKDLLNMRGMLKYFLFVVLVIGVSFSAFGSTQFTPVCAMMMAMLTITTMSYDHTSKWDKYALTMPLSRKQVVLAKYLVSLILIVSGTVFGMVFDFVVGLFRKKNEFEFLTTGVIIGVGIALVSILLPLIYKFGVEKARYLMMAVLLIPTLLVLAFVKLANWLHMDSPSAHILTLLLCLVPVAAVLLFAGSLSLSIHIYERKEF